MLGSAEVHVLRFGRQYICQVWHIAVIHQDRHLLTCRTILRFNWAARKLVRRLDQLGATTFVDNFEADERFNEG